MEIWHLHVHVEMIATPAWDQMGPISKSFYKVGTYRFLDCSFVVPTLLFQTETI